MGSGIASMFPGIGTAISIAIDAVSVFRDMGVIDFGSGMNDAISGTVGKISSGIGGIFESNQE